MKSDPQTVLIVSPESDDRERISSLCGELVADQGISLSVREVDDGLAAEEAYEEFQPYLIVTEVLLDHQSGLELLRRIRAKPDRHQPRVIFVSHLASDMDRYWGLRNGAQA